MTDQEIYRRAVYELQIFLRAARLEHPEIPEVKADGIYGPETRNAVGVFQEAYALPVTGEADQTTWETAREVYYRMLLETSAPQAPEIFCIFCQEDQKLMAGQGCDCVYVMQVMLRAIGERFVQFSGVEVTGVLDEATLHAMEGIRLATQGQEQGESSCGPATVKKLCWIYNCVQQGNLYHVWEE